MMNSIIMEMMNTPQAWGLTGDNGGKQQNQQGYPTYGAFNGSHHGVLVGLELQKPRIVYGCFLRNPVAK